MLSSFVRNSWKQSKYPTADNYKQIFHIPYNGIVLRNKKIQTTDIDEYQKHYANCKPDPETTDSMIPSYYVAEKAKLY